MSIAFEKYSDIIYSAFLFINKQAEVATKKKEILDEVLDHCNISPSSILFVGFSPSIILYKDINLYVTNISLEVQDYLKQFNCKYLSEDDLINRKFDVVVAFDEYLTFSQSDDDQRNMISNLSNMTTKCFITTLRDYKNQDFKNREFSSPIVIKGGNKKIFLEHYDYSMIDRNSYQTTCYIIDDNSVDIIGPLTRRNLFFKQLAKFSLDSGAISFLVHKNTMHKSIIKKNYEHIITIKF